MSRRIRRQLQKVPQRLVAWSLAAAVVLTGLTFFVTSRYQVYSGCNKSSRPSSLVRHGYPLHFYSTGATQNCYGDQSLIDQQVNYANAAIDAAMWLLVTTTITISGKLLMQNRQEAHRE